MVTLILHCKLPQCSYRLELLQCTAQRRGISRDTILAELRRMGAEIPSSSVAMLQVRPASHFEPVHVRHYTCPSRQSHFDMELQQPGQADSQSPHVSLLNACCYICQLQCLPDADGSLLSPGLQWAVKNRIDVRIISDCNTVFISHMLAAARISTAVSQVITNFASFRRVTPAQVRPTACTQ